MRNRIRVGEIDITDFRYPGGHRLDRHAHDRPMFCYAIHGAYRERTPRNVLEAGPGSVVFLPGGEPHWDQVSSEGITGLRVEVGDGLLANLPELTGKGPGLYRGRVEWYARTLVEELRRSVPPLRVSLESLAALVLAEITRQPHERESGAPRWLSRLRDRVHAEFADLPGLRELAHDVGRHPSHVARTFRKHMGCTIGEYARRRRIVAARGLVEGTDRPLSEVALDCGYADQSHMGRAFKARFGVSPGALRKRRGSG